MDLLPLLTFFSPEEQLMGKSERVRITLLTNLALSLTNTLLEVHDALEQLISGGILLLLAKGINV
jgi:hypothetical protein